MKTKKTIILSRVPRSFSICRKRYNLFRRENIIEYVFFFNTCIYICIYGAIFFLYQAIYTDIFRETLNCICYIIFRMYFAHFVRYFFIILIFLYSPSLIFLRPRQFSISKWKTVRFLILKYIHIYIYVFS